MAWAAETWCVRGLSVALTFTYRTHTICARAQLEKNIIFNMVRETQDHGSFNSWDRQPFYVERDGNKTYTPLYNEITRNFWVNDYNPQEAVDNDDGVCACACSCL